ncbi:ribonucleases P MRP subunit POP1 [Brachionus plicatilis]|uniref:Ribonucleases P MRP subunit POP1 n=1 Tax=Brachionus plicatilis TaxID=10195 RepID=A0A3M7PA86_BRAPC|nr:ribonucleases P MRP subunit POP1 [Brachionus plicatilis]
MLEVRIPFFRIFCSSSFRFIDKLVLFLNSSYKANKCAQYPNLVKNLQEHFLMLSILQFPREFYDTKSSQIENESLKENLYQKFKSRPPSKRVNFLKNGIVSPFYLPCKSILELNSGSELNSEKRQFFILRDKKILSNLSNALFNRNKQKKINFNISELEKFSDSYIGVRLESVGRGSLDQFSILYDYFEIKRDSEAEKTEQFHLRLVTNKIIDEYRKEFVKKNGNDSQITLNKLLRTKFNKFEILKEENWFFKYQMEYKDSEFYKLPLGFVCSSGFSLANGKCSANGLIVTKYLINLLDQKYNQNKFDKILLNYKEPNSSLFKTTKINQIIV